MKRAMTKRIAIIQSHPDPGDKHFLRALSDSYARGAAEAKHEIRTFEIARLDFPLLRAKEDLNTARRRMRYAKRRTPSHRLGASGNPLSAVVRHDAGVAQGVPG